MFEPFYGGSHKQWADGLAHHSRHNIIISGLPGRHWKWRMHGSALSFAQRHRHEIHKYDLVLVTDLCDVAVLKGLLRIEVPIILYFHENQLSYPWSGTDEDVRLNRDRHYMWINFVSAVAADHLWFNSSYNFHSFIGNLPHFLKAFPDHQKYNLDSLVLKSKILPLGLDLRSFLENNTVKTKSKVPHILWNHRWEYDKNPEVFFEVLNGLKQDGVGFELSVIGTKSQTYPEIFDTAKDWFKNEIINFGSIASRKDYRDILLKADILPVSSYQDFFGISVVEAIAAGCIPLLPNRLAYPEHIPIEKHPELFYLDDDELKSKLSYLLNNFPKEDLRLYVEKYDWNRCINGYDDLLQEIYTNHKR